MFRHIAMHMHDRGCGPWGAHPGGERGGREAHFGGGRGFGRGFGRGEGFGPGGGRERMFDSGEVRLVILQQLAEEPSYGYQLIKRLEERMAGGYTPSAGVIYPTLTMLEEQGLTAASTNEAGKKVYAVTDEGRAYLAEHRQRLQEIEARLKEAGRGFRRGRSPEIMAAFLRLRAAVAQKAAGGANAERMKQIADAVTKAAEAIEEL